jgi:signal transduction histidine kinase
MINVEDAGPGIAPDDARYVFEPFYRGRGSDRVRGSGLGLTIVKRIVDEHRGTVTVGRSSRGGAAFTITLPERRHV